MTTLNAQDMPDFADHPDAEVLGEHDYPRKHLHRWKSLDAIREQGVALVNLGSDRYVPATNITGAEAFTKEDAERLRGDDYTLK